MDNHHFEEVNHWIKRAKDSMAVIFSPEANLSRCFLRMVLKIYPG